MAWRKAEVIEGSEHSNEFTEEETHRSLVLRGESVKWVIQGNAYILVWGEGEEAGVEALRSWLGPQSHMLRKQQSLLGLENKREIRNLLTSAEVRRDQAFLDNPGCWREADTGLSMEAAGTQDLKDKNYHHSHNFPLPCMFISMEIVTGNKLVLITSKAYDSTELSTLLHWAPYLS